MKKLRTNIRMYILFFIAITISLLILLSFSSSSVTNIKIGSKAPNFKLLNQDGELVITATGVGVQTERAVDS